MAPIELTESREARVGTTTVRRALPRRGRRTVGAWCFADHMGPAEGPGMSIGPHPHIGLQTVTWLVDGELVHRDSLGSEQPIRPGQLNLMTAGRGVSHSEEPVPGWHGRLHGIQLWVAQPEETRWGDAAFEHHDELPQVDLATGTATVLVGAFAGASSPARRDTEHLGVDLDLRAGTAVLPLDGAHEHALVVLDGEVVVDEQVVGPGHLGYLDPGRDELALTVPDGARVVLLGGVPFPDELVMWWNFVARSRDEVSDAYVDWAEGHDRYGEVATQLGRIPVDPPAWLR